LPVKDSGLRVSMLKQAWVVPALSSMFLKIISKSLKTFLKKRVLYNAKACSPVDCRLSKRDNRE
jgi:hypothetical protein